MLINLFEKSDQYYHVFQDAKTGELYIADDCPSDRFEDLIEEDAEYYRKYGKHLYRNFEEE